MIQASVVKRQENGILLVELFESEGPSLNVQLLKMDCVQLDESLQPLLCSNFTSAGLEGSGLSQNQRSSNLLVTSNQSSHVHMCCIFPQFAFSHLKFYVLYIFTLYQTSSVLNLILT